MAGKKKQQKRLKKATEKAEQLSSALVAQTRSVGADARMAKKATKSLAKEARFAATVNKTNAKRLAKETLAYISCLTNPTRENKTRYPDGFPRRTALLHSLQTISVMPNSANATDILDKGRFAFCVSPTIAGSRFIRAASGFGPVESSAGVPLSNTTYYQYSQGCKVAEMNPEAAWDPDTSFQDLTPAPSPLTKKLVGPPIPTNNQWRYYSDPNTTPIAGTIYTATNNTQYFENGAAESIRPVAMSVWLQRDASDMLNGGECAIALLPPDSLAGNVIPYNWNDATPGTAIWGGQGPIVNVENLAGVPGAYSGPLRDGAYCYWLPHRIDDTEFLSVLDHVKADFPIIAVAGKAQTYDQGEVARLVINTVWEYTTVDQTRETAIGGFDPEVWAVVKHVLRTQPTAMANDEHIAWWKHLLKLAASAGVGFLSGGPIGAVTGAAGYALGSL